MAVHLPVCIQRICHVEHIKKTEDGVTEEIFLLLHETGEAEGPGSTPNPIYLVALECTWNVLKEIVGKFYVVKGNRFFFFNIFLFHKSGDKNLTDFQGSKFYKEASKCQQI